MVRQSIRRLLPLVILFSGLSWGHDHAVVSAAAEELSPMARQWQARLVAAKGTSVSVTADEQGGLWSVSMRQGHIWLARSTDHGKTFADEVKVNAKPEAILADGQSRPMLAVDGSVVLVSWAQALPKVHTGHVRLARSVDGGRSFSEPVTVNDDGNEVGHSFNVMKMDERGRVVIAWLDGRERAASAKNGRAYRGSAVYYTVSDDRGATFSANRKLADHSCECCRIGLDIGPDGVPVAQWRHIFGDNIRDFAVAPLQTGTAAGKVVRASEDGWKITACPHHGGDISIDSDGRRHLVWFTGASASPGLHYRYQDGDRFGAVKAFGNLDAQAGHGVVHARGRQVHVAWREYESDHYRIMAMTSGDRGVTWSPAREVARAAGNTDLPVFVGNSRRPLLAWSTGDELRILDLEAAR